MNAYPLDINSFPVLCWYYAMTRYGQPCTKKEILDCFNSADGEFNNLPKNEQTPTRLTNIRAIKLIAKYPDYFDYSGTRYEILGKPEYYTTEYTPDYPYLVKLALDDGIRFYEKPGDCGGENRGGWIFGVWEQTLSPEEKFYVNFLHENKELFLKICAEKYYKNFNDREKYLIEVASEMAMIYPASADERLRSRALDAWEFFAGRLDKGQII